MPTAHQEGAGRYHALHVEVTIGDAPAILSACWSDGSVEVETRTGSRIWKVDELLAAAPHLLPALTVMVERVCRQDLAETWIGRMRAVYGLLELAGADKGKGGTVRSGEIRTAGPKISSGRRNPNLYVGSILLQDVSPDGRLWTVGRRRLTLNRMAHIYGDLLGDLVVAACPVLENAHEFCFAVVAARPSLGRHPDLRGYRLQRRKGRPDLQVSPAYLWVFDELNAPHPLMPSHLRVPGRALNNRTRFVR